MTVAEKINSYIRQHWPDSICDGCIARELDLAKPHAQQITSALGTTRDFIREDGICSMCGKEKRVTRRA